MREFTGGQPILIPLIKMNAKPRTEAHFGVIAPIILAAQQLIRNLPSGAREIETNCAPAAGPKLGSGTLRVAAEAPLPPGHGDAASQRDPRRSPDWRAGRKNLRGAD